MEEPKFYLELFHYPHIIIQLLFSTYMLNIIRLIFSI